MTVTIWSTLSDPPAIATRTEITGYTEPEGEEAPEPIYGDPIVLARIAPGQTVFGVKWASWARPTRTAQHRADPASHGAANFMAGERILDVVDIKPSLGQYERLGAMGEGVPDLELGRMTYTWAVISADAFDPATHHPPVWTGTEWLAAVEKSTAELQSLVAAKGADLLTAIDVQAGIERAKYASAIWGQETVYLAKENEAIAWTADNEIDAASIPYLTAEVAARSIAIGDLVAEIMANSAGWRGLSVYLEAHRMGLKQTVHAAVAMAMQEVDPDPVAALLTLQALDPAAGWPAP